VNAEADKTAKPAPDEPDEPPMARLETATSLRQTAARRKDLALNKKASSAGFF